MAAKVVIILRFSFSGALGWGFACFFCGLSITMIDYAKKSVSLQNL